ncbi:MAG: FAD-dependent monooxygenase, partial [Actinocatenispora sp.]
MPDPRTVADPDRPCHDTDVLVVGAGPTGLLLAAELDLAGARVMVAEQQPRRTGQSRALSLQPRSAEILHSRGWLEPLRAHVHAELPAGHFAGIPLDYTVFDTRFPYQLGIEQARIEEDLEDRLARRGVPVLRGHTFTGLDQDDERVRSTLDTGTGTGTGAGAGRRGRRRITSRYVVGADGAHSAVRRHLDVPFPGRDGRIRMAVADITLTRRPTGVAEGWALPSFGAGAIGYLLPLRGGVFRLVFAGPEQQELDRTADITPAEVQRALTAAHGPDIEVGTVLWASRFTDASRQVERYREGRVLLAGDAAHIHLPAGGQGLNLGLQDAFNLGWKLAAELRGGAPATLLDTYHAERHPVAERVLVNTRTQGVLTVPDIDVAAVRQVFGELLQLPEVNRRVAGEISGLDIRYAIPGGGRHPLLGARVPDLDLGSPASVAGVPSGSVASGTVASGTVASGTVASGTVASGTVASAAPPAAPTSTVYGLLRAGRAVLLDRSDRAGPSVDGWRDRVSHVRVRGVAGGDADADAMLIRPDGHVCWVAGAGGPELDDAL